MNEISGSDQSLNLSTETASEMPLVTVSMAAYNSAKYISEAIESVLAQTYSNFEFIIVDDGSTDGTRGVIERYDDPRIIKIFLKENGGLIAARNHIASVAKGKYLALLDADDFAMPERLAIQVRFLEDNAVDVCGADHWTLNQETGVKKSSKQRHSDSDIRALLTVCSPLCNPAVMGKTEVFKRLQYKKSYLYAEDYCLWTNISVAGYKFSNIKEKLIIYRLHSSQNSVNHIDSARLVFTEAQAAYLEFLGVPSECYPRPLLFNERLRFGLKFMTITNKTISGVSVGANAELYARFQFRGNGIWTPFTRLERLFIATYASLIGRLTK